MNLTLQFSTPVAEWFTRHFAEPTPIQAESWPWTLAGDSVLLAAPTGSGKTLAAFLAVIDRQARRVMAGEPSTGLRAIYVTPLRALSTDIASNLEAPLAAVEAALRITHPQSSPLTLAVRTGDTGAYARSRFLKSPTDFLVTTPESLFILLGSKRGRAALSTVETVIVDEIHALVDEVRGAHLLLSLERLDRLAGRRLQRIGLSATLEPPALLGDWLRGGGPPVRVVDARSPRLLDLAIETPTTNLLSSVASDQQIDQILDRVASLIDSHRCTLVFTNTRRLAERLAFRLEERIGKGQVSAHHGSLAPAKRREVELRLKAGQQRAVVATGSLELGIDVGACDLVVQIGSPRRISTLVQRAGRACHQVGGVPKAVLFPLTRDDLLECAAAVESVKAGRLERARPVVAPEDALAQHLVSELAFGALSPAEIGTLVRGAWAYRDQNQQAIDHILAALEGGLSTSAGKRGAWLLREGESGLVHARAGAERAALMQAGTIPDLGDFRVVAEGTGELVGTVGEDFAVESAVGDVFLIGTRPWRVRGVRSSELVVQPCPQMAPTVPFWVGDAKGRSQELSEAVSALRSRLAASVEAPEGAASGLDAAGMSLVHRYCRVGVEALGVCPSSTHWVAERFFDGAGGQQLVIHAPIGNRINRALGLLLRKRLCRSFDQELQAAATDDAVLVSLTETQSFPLESLPKMFALKGASDSIDQAILLSPMFKTRFRWCAARALYLGGGARGRRAPFPVQRFLAEDLLASAFPASQACQEHQTFPIDIPSHFLVQAALRECREEATDVPGLLRALEQAERGQIQWTFREIATPSVFAHDIIHARPSAYLDDAPIEERRTRTVTTPRSLPEEVAQGFGVTEKVILSVEAELRSAPPRIGLSHERLHDLVWTIRGDEEFEALIRSGRALVAESDGHSPRVYSKTRAEAVDQLRFGDSEEVRRRLIGEALQGHIAWQMPRSIAELSGQLGVPTAAVEEAALVLQAQGQAFLGHFDPRRPDLQVCDRAMLQRLVSRAREARRIVDAPLSRWAYLTWLARRHGVFVGEESPPGATLVLARLRGWSAQALDWHDGILASRIGSLRVSAIEAHFSTRAGAWRGASLAPLHGRTLLQWGPPWTVCPSREEALTGLTHEAQALWICLEEQGNASESELARRLRTLSSRVETSLRELLGRGLVHFPHWASLVRKLRGEKGRRARRAAVPEPVVERFEGPPALPESELDWALQASLERFGVVSADLLRVDPAIRSVGSAIRQLRLWELRGLVRTGFFVEGLSGEQWVLASELPSLRASTSLAAAPALVVHRSDPIAAVVPLLWEKGAEPSTDSNDSLPWLSLGPDRWQRSATPVLPQVVPG